MAQDLIERKECGDFLEHLEGDDAHLRVEAGCVELANPVDDHQSRVSVLLSPLLLAHAILGFLFFSVVDHETELSWDELLEALDSFIVFAESVHAWFHWLHEFQLDDGVFNFETLSKDGIYMIPDQSDAIIRVQVRQSLESRPYMEEH
eukprot:CAMPEP_0170457264 /NCGR_PEP_ID=MMETSP0123-20130129/4615_1 /TAXON_ID=182087 /ORGANISM="Favella ehrenbergii, Strain Fehren 1" /LENGTH=147 /DNA_ID=CAMNT_0010721001 /DNA_START=3940 /DNA_END=4383 /DNA_ORIENTATION=-